MSALRRGVVAFLLSCVAGVADAGADVQPYPISPERQQLNAARIAAEMDAAPDRWKTAPFVYFEVPAISPVKRLPDTFPVDGRFLGSLDLVAAQGEFEPGSIVLYPLRPVEKLELRASELRNGRHTIPASALDLKVVKVWYQAGSAWYGYFADRTQRVPIPELLLNDETLIRVDHETGDNYVRYNCPDGSQRYAWMSFGSAAVNHSYLGQANSDLISDSADLRPVSLVPGEFKQFFVTVCVPGEAAPGVYAGSIAFVADGAEVGTVPVLLRVLPFQLPRPATYYDLNKEFYGSIYCQPLRLDCPRMLRNLRDHNILNPMLPRAYRSAGPEAFKRMIEQLKAAGLSTRPLFGAGPYARERTDEPPTPAQQFKLDVVGKEAAATVADAEESAGHREVYSYGYDEGGPGTIRKERAAWRSVHEAGGRVMVSSRPHGRLLYNLDYVVFPGMPVEARARAVDRFHEANPDMLVAWYANPHSGPENPDYFRRLHGMMTYKANYDAISNYVWYRNNWNDFWVPAESNLRGLVMVYPAKDDVIDTLAWEGLREGLDDIRYATKLKQLALAAMRSGAVKAMYAGRKAMSWLAHWDAYREDLSAARLEMVNHILALRAALEGS